MDAQVPPRVVQFEQFRLDRHAGRLLRSTQCGYEPVSLGSRAFAVLCSLVDRGGGLVSKDEIMAAVWPGTVVEEANLTVQISALRRALDEGRRNGSCIQTIAGRGYRFVPTIAPVDEGLPEPRTQNQPDQPMRLPRPLGLLGDGRWSTLHGSEPQPGMTLLQRTASDRRGSLLILPFEDASHDMTQEAVAAQITREVTNRILSAPDGAVIVGSKTRAQQRGPIDPRAIGREHDVHFVLTGNTHRRDGRVFVTPVLYETADGGPAWARQLEMSDDPDELRNIAQVIYESSWQKRVDLEAWHALRDRPHSLDTRDLIFIARSTALWCPTKTNYLEKLSLVDRALALDPHYLRGWERRARLLVELVLLGHSSDPVTDVARATEAADHALAIDAHAQLSLRVKAAVLRARGDWPEAEAVQRRVIELLPTESFRHYELGVILMARGRHREALTSLQAARRSAAGNNPVYWYDGEIAAAYLALGQLAEAIATAQLAIGEMPPDISRGEELPRLALIAATSLCENNKSARADMKKFISTPRSWHSLAEVQKWSAFAANPNLLEGLRRAGMPGG